MALPPLQPPPATSALSATAAIVAFSEHHIEPTAFAPLVGAPWNWIRSGASLLRAARALVRQFDSDMAAFITQGSQKRIMLTVDAQSLMLAAMACEDALKGLTLARDPALRGAITDKLPRKIRGHDLWTQAQHAQYAHANAEEEAALRAGEYFITWIGRYPTTLTAETQPAGSMRRSPGLHAAYAAIFLSCVEGVAVSDWAPGGRHVTAADAGAAARVTYESLTR